MTINALLPLEQLALLPLPATLDGSQGRERAKPCLIRAANDIEAITAWLNEYKKSAMTYRNYRKDAERLLLWAIRERQKPLSSLDSEDVLAYSQFLENPQPATHWCGPKRAKRWTPGWRPFVGPLGTETKKAALKNITSLFNFLTDVHYLAHNPLRAVRRQVRQSAQSGIEEQRLRITARIIAGRMASHFINIGGAAGGNAQ